MAPDVYAPGNLSSTRIDAGSGTLCDRSGQPDGEPSGGTSRQPDPSQSLAANAARTPHPSDNPATLRKLNTALANVIVEQADILKRIKSYAVELSSRSGATIDPATVAARLAVLCEGGE